MTNIFRKIAFPLFLICFFPGCQYWLFDYFWKTGKGAENIIEVVDKAKFEEVVLKHENPVVVRFAAPWCGACRLMDQIYEDAAKEYKGRVRFVEINIDKAKAIADEHEIKGVPAFLYFKKGKEINRILGVLEEEEFKKSVEKLLE